jgi:hypothetical protein
MRLNLLDEIARLANEPQCSHGHRSSIVLARDARFRVVLGPAASDDRRPLLATSCLP